MKRLISCPSAILLLTLLVMGCQDPHASPSVTERDSAGITIVLSEGPTWREGDEWALSPRPRLELSAEVEDPDLLIYEVTGLAVLPDGRFVISNHGDSSLRLYEEGGSLVWKVGGPGDGPGEFRDLRGVVPIGDELWAYQMLPHPVKVFGVDGEFRRTVETPPLGGPNLRGILADGFLVVRGRSFGTANGRVWTDSTTLIRFREGVTDTIASLPYLRRVDLGRLGQDWQALGPFLHEAVGDEVIYAGYSSDWDIGVWDESGRLIRRIRRRWEPQPVTQDHLETYKSGLIALAQGEPGTEEVYRELANSMVFPDHHAAHERLLVDGAGALWVQRAQTDPPWYEGIDYTPVPPDRREWDVFAPAGAWLGSVTLPARFRVMDIGTDHVAGVWKDELDVEHVQIWDLIKPN